MWLISRDLKNVSSDTIPSPLSDHISICIPLSDTANLQRTSYWKLNVSLLKYNQVKDKINFIIANYWEKASKENNFCSNWELAKYLRTFSSKLTKKKKIKRVL